MTSNFRFICTIHLYYDTHISRMRRRNDWPISSFITYPKTFEYSILIPFLLVAFPRLYDIIEVKIEKKKIKSIGNRFYSQLI